MFQFTAWAAAGAMMAITNARRAIALVECIGMGPPTSGTMNVVLLFRLFMWGCGVAKPIHRRAMRIGPRLGTTIECEQETAAWRRCGSARGDIGKDGRMLVADPERRQRGCGASE